MCWTVFCFVASKSFQRQSASLFRQTILSISELFLAQRTRPSHPHASTYEEDVSACIGIDRIQSRDMGTSRLRSMFHPQQRFTVWSISLRAPSVGTFLNPSVAGCWQRSTGGTLPRRMSSATLFLFESIIYILHTSLKQSFFVKKCLLISSVFSRCAGLNLRDPDPLLGYTPGATNQYKPHVFGSGSDFGEDDSPARRWNTIKIVESSNSCLHLQQMLQLHDSKSVIEFAKSVMWTFFCD